MKRKDGDGEGDEQRDDESDDEQRNNSREMTDKETRPIDDSLLA